MTLNWLDMNEGRDFPLAESGGGLPTDVIASLLIEVPGTRWMPYLASISLGPEYVSLVIADGAGNHIAWARSTPAPHQIVVLEPLVDGVFGTVVFGHGVLTRRLRQDLDAVSGRLAPGAARLLPAAAVDSLLVQNQQGLAGLSGLVELRTDDAIEVSTYEVELDGTTYQAIELALRQTLSDDVQHRLAGNCSRNTEVRSCALPGIQSVNGVRPDCSGRIDLRVYGAAELEAGNSGQLVFATPLTGDRNRRNNLDTTLFQPEDLP